MTPASSMLNISKGRVLKPVPFLVGALSLVIVLWLGGCGGGGDKREAAVDTRPVDYGSSRDFPVPAEIQSNVNFWRNVYGVWGRNMVAFHDDEHLGVIYEVAELPGAGVEGYSEGQRAFVRARQAYYQDLARDLERKVSSSLPLTPEEQSILAKFERDGGTRAVYGAAERVRSQRGLRERFRRGLEISGRYDKAFREIMRANGLPEDLAYLPHVESSFQMNAVSSAGATGVWQFMPATGRSYMNVNGAVDDRLCPIVSAEGAARYLSQAHRRLGTWPLAITSYNHGQGGMANARAQFGDDFGRIVKNYQGKAFKFASRNYYAEFLAAREVAGHPQRYFPEGVRFDSPWPHERLILASSLPADTVAGHYGVSTLTLASANPHWRAGVRDGRTPLPAGTTVWLPAGSRARSGVPGIGASGLLTASGSTGGSTGAFGRPLTEAAASAAFRAVQAEPVLAALPEPEPPRYPRATRAQAAVDLDDGGALRPGAAAPRSAPTLAQSGSPLALAEARRAEEASRKLPVAEEWHAQYQPQRSSNAPVRGRRGRVDAARPWPEPELAASGVETADPGSRPVPTPVPTPVRTPAAEPGPRLALAARSEPVLTETTPVSGPDAEARLRVSRVPEPRIVAAAPPEPRASEPRITEPRSAEPQIAGPQVREPRITEPRITESRRSEPRLAELDLADVDVDVDVDADADADADAARPEPRRRKAARAARSEPSEPRVARAETRGARSETRPTPAAAKADAKGAKPERTAKADAKGAKGERTAKADTKDAKAERTAKADAKGAKAERTAKADGRDAKADAKASKTAKADPKADAKAARTAKADTKGAKGEKAGSKPERTAKADTKDAKPDARSARTAKAEKGDKAAKGDKAGGAKVHVVKAQETLFRVASGNGISVAELRKLNKLGPNDNHVRPGQKLKVGT